MKYARLAFAYFLVHLASKFINIKKEQKGISGGIEGMKYGFFNIALLVILIPLFFLIHLVIKIINNGGYDIMSAIGMDSTKFAVLMYDISIVILSLLSLVSLVCLLFMRLVSRGIKDTNIEECREALEADNRWICSIARLSGILATFVFKLATLIFITLFISTYPSVLANISSEKNSIIDSVSDDNLRVKLKDVEVKCVPPNSYEYDAVISNNLDGEKYRKVFGGLRAYESELCEYHSKMYGNVAIYLLGVSLYMIYWTICKWRKGDWV